MGTLQPSCLHEKIAALPLSLPRPRLLHVHSKLLHFLSLSAPATPPNFMCLDCHYLCYRFSLPTLCTTTLHTITVLRKPRFVNSIIPRRFTGRLSFPRWLVCSGLMQKLQAWSVNLPTFFSRYFNLVFVQLAYFNYFLLFCFVRACLRWLSLRLAIIHNSPL